MRSDRTFIILHQYMLHVKYLINK